MISSKSILLLISLAVLTAGFRTHLPTALRRTKTPALRFVPETHEAINQAASQIQHLPSLLTAEEAVSIYSKVDKTGVIGFIATYVEVAIDFGRSIFQKISPQNSYGFSIILFTMLSEF